jgi:hypothetical protein
MNHPEQIVSKVRESLLADERVFYCKFDPTIIFIASDTVSKDLDSVVFISAYVDGLVHGIISTDRMKEFIDDTWIVFNYSFKDFIEIDKLDSSVWD